MNTNRVNERGLEVRSASAATLVDFKLVFNKVSKHHVGVAHANIEYAPGEEVEGVLYELANDAEILKMDVFENTPINYGRDAVQVVSDSAEGSGRLWTWTYFANPAVQVSDHLPTQEYLNHLLAGAPFLSESYYQKLLAQEVVAS